MIYDLKTEQKLINTFVLDPRFRDDPYTWVMAMYPWGKKGTPLEHHKGPRKWQAKVLVRMRDHIAEQRAKGVQGIPPDMLQIAIASGRGPGKSALVGMICHWFMTVCPGGTALVAANTEPQLISTTFPEIRKWFALGLNAHWWQMMATTIRPVEWYADMLLKDKGIESAYYYVNAQLWSEEKPDAFAGKHSTVGMLLIFDEASGIPSSIWSVAEFYFTDLTILRFWFAFSNARHNSGGFYDAFHEPGSEWDCDNIDARDVEGLDHAKLVRAVERLGEDSFEARVEILGLFPRQGEKQFIASELVKAAQTRDFVPDHGAPLIMGVDVARFGDDFNVARFRQGNDARSIRAVKWGGIDYPETADKVAQLINDYNPDAVCIDSGYGAAVCAILRTRGYKTHEIMFGASAGRHEFANKATEMYADLRDWLRGGGAIDDDKLLFKDLTGRDYNMHGKGKDQIILEPKDVFKKKNKQRSPDDGDALALTFAVKISRRDTRVGQASKPRMAQGLDYSLFGE